MQYWGMLSRWWPKVGMVVMLHTYTPKRDQRTHSCSPGCRCMRFGTLRVLCMVWSIG